MNERINKLRLNAGISAALHPYMVAVNKEGEIIDPLKGLQKFAELIVQECANEIQLSTNELSDEYHVGFNTGLVLASKIIKQHFGVAE